MNKTPHAHQEDAILRLRQSLSAGKRRVVIQAPTGAGKTVLSCMIIEGALRKGKRVIFVVDAISLVDQTIQAFWNEDIRDVGVIQANHPLTDYSKPVQVASVQTLKNRELLQADIVIVDECHVTYQFVEDWMAHPDWYKVPFVGLSATPWTKGMGKHWDELIIAETTQGLIDKGFLSPFRVFASGHPDLKGVKTIAGDYHEGQLAEVMSGKAIVAGVVETWLKHGRNEPTLCFAVDCAHAQKLQAEFEAAGIRCGYIYAHTDREERAIIKKQFHDGDIKVVCSVGTMIKGVDWDVRCISDARPTKSEMLHVQKIGRGLRTAKGKSECRILDHADNTLRLGFVTDIYHDELNTGKKSSGSDEQEKKAKLPKECPSCTYLKPVGVHKCPNCGFEPVKVSNVKTIAGDLVEWSTGNKPKKNEYSMAQKQLWYSGFLHIEHERGYKNGWSANQYREKFGVWPNQLQKISTEPTLDVANYVRSRQIAYAKRRA